MTKAYATLKRRFTAEALRQIGFRQDGPRMVKRGACRLKLAEASSLDGIGWRLLL